MLKRTNGSAAEQHDEAHQSPPEWVRLRLNLAKSTLSPSQRISFLGTVLESAQMRAIVTPERVLAVQRLATIGTTCPLKTFQKVLGLMAAASPALQLGLLRMRSLQHWLEPQVQSRAWRHRRLSIRVSLSPLEEPSLDGKGRGHGKGLQENVVCLQHRLKSWLKEEKMLHTTTWKCYQYASSSCQTLRDTTC